MRLTLGIDIGSRTTKAVVWDGSRILGKKINLTRWHPQTAAKETIAEVLTLVAQQEGISLTSLTIHRTVATGYGRVVLPQAEAVVTEITAHAKGAAKVSPEARFLVDIGGQDTKVIAIDNGLVGDFAMNDRCAAGSGKFIEHLAASMNLSVNEFASLAHKSHKPSVISTICTVFAESEVLSLLAEGVAPEDIAAGVHHAIALRIFQMAQILSPSAPGVISGGGALNPCLIKELSDVFGFELIPLENAEYIGALGAAILAEQGII